MRTIITCIAAVMVSASAFAETRLNTSVLPGGRSVEIGNAATAFLSVVNGVAGDEATGCSLVLNNAPAGTFSYRQTDAANVPTGPDNPEFTVAPGETRSFVFGFTPIEAASAVETYPDVVCANGSSGRISGLNSFLLSASATPVPDIIPISATISNDGVVRSASTGQRQAFSLAAINVGAGDIPAGGPVAAPQANEATIDIVPTFGTLPFPAALLVCPTDAQGACLVPLASSARVQIGDAPVTFKVIVDPDDRAGIPLYPDIVRINVEFRDTNGTARGSTSVAVTSPQPDWPFPWQLENWFDYSASNGIGSTAMGLWVAYVEPSNGPAYVAPIVGYQAASGSNLYQYLFIPVTHMEWSDGLHRAALARFFVGAPAGQGATAVLQQENSPPADMTGFEGEYLLNTFLRLRATHPGGSTSRIRAVYHPLNFIPIAANQVSGRYEFRLPGEAPSGEFADLTHGGHRFFGVTGSFSAPLSFHGPTENGSGSISMTGSLGMSPLEGEPFAGPYAPLASIDTPGFRDGPVMFYDFNSRAEQPSARYSFMATREYRWANHDYSEVSWIILDPVETE